MKPRPNRFCPACGIHLPSVLPSGAPACFTCPACGRNTPAADPQTATSLWFNRLALVCLLGWTGYMFIYTALMGLLLYGFFSVCDDALISNRLESLDGRRVEQRFVAGDYKWFEVGTQRNVTSPGEEIPKSMVVYTRDYPLWYTGRTPRMNYYEGRTHWVESTFACVVMLLATCLVGMIYATVCWHWKPGRMYFWLLGLLPFWVMLVIDSRTSYYTTYWNIPTVDKTWPVLPLLILVAFMGAFALGLRFGRPMMRQFLRMVFPLADPESRCRGLLGFLWTCDGKQMPVAAR